MLKRVLLMKHPYGQFRDTYRIVCEDSSSFWPCSTHVVIPTRFHKNVAVEQNALSEVDKVKLGGKVPA